MSNAFASILQARPSPAFGRPVHLRGSPLDYGPVLLLMPFGFHLTMDTLPSGNVVHRPFSMKVANLRLRRQATQVPTQALRGLSRKNRQLCGFTRSFC